MPVYQLFLLYSKIVYCILKCHVVKYSTYYSLKLTLKFEKVLSKITFLGCDEWNYNSYTVTAVYISVLYLISLTV